MYLISCHNENWMGGMVVGLKELMGFVSFGWCHWLGGTWLGFGGLKDDGIELRAFLLLASHEYIWIHMNTYEYIWIHVNTHKYICMCNIYIFIYVYIIWWSMFLLMAETKDPATYPTKVYSSSGSGWWGTKEQRIMAPTWFICLLNIFGRNFICRSTLWMIMDDNGSGWLG
jgi:hypothetical protein